MKSHFNITKFGAERGKVCTEAIEKAFEAASEQGGGTVVVPAGTWLTGPIKQPAHTTLEISDGAVLKFSDEIKDFPVVLNRWEGVTRETYMSLIYAEDAEDVNIVGRGTIDGSGAKWWDAHRAGQLSYPRPRFINYTRCDRVLIEGIKIINSPSWTVTPLLCNNVTIHGITIINPYDSPNTDGIDPDSCRNVHISDCYIDVGDDCIAVKAGTEGAEEMIPCENLTITGCTMVHGHGGVVIGSEMSGSVRNVTIAGCVFDGTDRGLRLKTRRLRGGSIEHIMATGIIMRNVLCPFVINMFYYCGPDGKREDVQDKNARPVTDMTPTIRDVRFMNCSVYGARAAAGYFHGLPENPFTEVRLSGVTIEMAKDAEPGMPAMLSDVDPMAGAGFICENMSDVTFTDVELKGVTGEPMRFKNCTNVKVDGRAQ
jgi:polygalacturonase